MDVRRAVDRQAGRAGIGVVVTLLAVVAIGVLVWRGIGSRAKALDELTRDTREQAVPSVGVVKPTRGVPQEELMLPGTLQAFVDAPIYARTGGYLKKRYVDMGARVKSGQLLAELDAPELEQQIQQARADLATADANAKLAQTTADRYRELLKTDSVSQQDADNAAGTLEARKTAVVSAKHNVQRLEELQRFTRIYAPFAGVITARNTDVGALIDSGASGGTARELFHISVTDRLRLFISVPELYSQAVKPGLTASLTLVEFPGRTFAAKAVRTSESLDSASRTLLVEFEVPNGKGELLAGAYAEVHVRLPAPAATLRLPANALVFRADGLRAATVTGGNTVVMKAIAVGRDFGAEVEIVSGLSGDEAVILNPPDSLAEGQVVKVVAAKEPVATGRGAAK